MVLWDLGGLIDMGRKRIPRGKTREPITISMPRDLIIQLDATIPQDHTRSRLIESLVRKYLRINTTLNSFDRHLYGCLDCHNEVHLNRRIDADILTCKRKLGGCGGTRMVYHGILEEE